MRIVDNIRSYILEDEFKLTYLNKRLNIINYTSIGHFDNNKIIVKYQNGQVNIKGNNLVVSKLLNDEVLIEGNVSNIEIR